jgi:hypothetical protein
LSFVVEWGEPIDMCGCGTAVDGEVEGSILLRIKDLSGIFNANHAARKCPVVLNTKWKSSEFDFIGLVSTCTHY